MKYYWRSFYGNDSLLHYRHHAHYKRQTGPCVTPKTETIEHRRDASSLLIHYVTTTATTNKTNASKRMSVYPPTSYKSAYSQLTRAQILIILFPLLCLKYGVEVSKLSIPWLYVTRVADQMNIHHESLCSSLFYQHAIDGRLCERNRLEGRA